MVSPPSIKISPLKKRADFLRLRRGSKFTCSYFVLRFMRAESISDAARVGYTVTIKCGNAVVRNRIKRRLRAVVAELFPGAAKPGWDYNFIALENATLQDVPHDELKREIQRAIEYAGARA